MTAPSARPSVAVERPAHRQFIAHALFCWLYARGIWCQDCDHLEVDAQREARTLYAHWGPAW